MIEEEKAGDKVKVNSLDQFVLPLAAGEMQYQCRLSVEGKFPEEQAEMADALKAKLMVAGSKVKGFACNIGCPKGIGSKMGVIKDVIDCRGGETDG